MIFFCKIRLGISIHAPSRERRGILYLAPLIVTFQSTLPHGSDYIPDALQDTQRYFNPRSLAGATMYAYRKNLRHLFQSTLPCGSDLLAFVPNLAMVLISIHAPLRERHHTYTPPCGMPGFQSTLPCGSDVSSFLRNGSMYHFNPRSLAGATLLPLLLVKLI